MVPLAKEVTEKRGGVKVRGRGSFHETMDEIFRRNHPQSRDGRVNLEEANRSTYEGFRIAGFSECSG